MSEYVLIYVLIKSKVITKVYLTTHLIDIICSSYRSDITPTYCKHKCSDFPINRG